MSSTLLEPGDNVIVMPHLNGNYAAYISTPDVGEDVIIYNLSNDTQIAVPTLTFDIDKYYFVMPSFDFAGFNWNLDFDFELIPLAFSLHQNDPVYGTTWDWDDWEFESDPDGSPLVSGAHSIGGGGPAGYTGYGRVIIYRNTTYTPAFTYTASATFPITATGIGVYMYIQLRSGAQMRVYVNDNLLGTYVSASSWGYRTYSFGSSIVNPKISFEFYVPCLDGYAPTTEYGVTGLRFT